MSRIIKINDIQLRRDFLSVDRQCALSAEGEFFKIGDIVKHESQGDEEAIITKFKLDKKNNDVRAVTDKGSAAISFIYNK